jgi:plastocyanin
VKGTRVGGVLTVLLFGAFTVAGPVMLIKRHVTTSGGVTDRGAADAPLVVMQNIKFQPATLVVKRGATVRFDNKDVAPHTVTVTGVSDSGIIAPGGTYSLTVTKAFDYVCTIHPSMKATIDLSG